MSAGVFLGPTLPAAEAATVLDATWLPPVKLGDVYRVVSRLRPRAIGIVDGYFQWAPAVWHKEILWAIGQGVHVFGSASMGALRAAELAPFGMRGVGRIFEAYREGRLDGAGDEPFEDDDEVAVAHGPSESGYLGASEAMVNIRCTLDKALDEGLIRDATRRSLTAIAKAAFFPDRGYGPMLAQARANGLSEPEIAALQRWLPSGRVNQKRLDAVAMLEAMRDFIAEDPPPARATFTFERTTYWERAEATLRASGDSSPASLLAALRLDASRCERMGEDDLRDWFFERVAESAVPADLGRWMQEAGYADPSDFHRAAFAEYLSRQAADDEAQAPNHAGAP